MTDPFELRCLLCGSGPLEPLPSRTLAGVSSDCKPWPEAGQIAVCAECGHVQKTLDDRWRAAAASIYANYELYHQSGGVEQVLFGTDAAARTRSSVVLEALAREVDLPENGWLLDVGCGNGATLRAASATLPGWRLAGAEQNDRCREGVLRIPGVETFCSGSLASVRQRFDVISLVHVLEHVTAPVDLLRQFGAMLRPEGAILIQVPDLARNPFDMLVADHCSHFVGASLVESVQRAGLGVQALSDGVVAKELTLIARAEGNVTDGGRSSAGRELAVEGLAWLSDVSAHAEALRSRRPFGIFGTAIAGTWLGGRLLDDVGFFVDEDRLRHGRRHVNRAILMPEEVPSGATVYMPLPWEAAQAVFGRLHAAHRDVDYTLPPKPRQALTAAGYLMRGA